MDSNIYIAKARAAGEAAKHRRTRAFAQEVSAFCSGGIMVLTGLILAFGYCVLKHQLQI
jgi:hypothetical protein